MTIRRNAPALPLVLLLAACAGSGAVERSRQYLAEGFLLQAFTELDRERTQILQDGSEPSAEFERTYQEVRRRWLIERGRQEIYADQELRGIATLQLVLDLDPQNADAQALVDRANRKLAKREVADGLEHLAKNDFEAAIVSFRRAQQYKPGFRPAVEGQEAVEARVARLHGEAQKQFLEAIRKLPEMRYPEVDWHAQAAIARDPSREDAADVKQKALRELAQTSRERGDAARTAKEYGAALMEYRSARDLWAEMPGIGETIVQMEREVQATWKTERAQLEMEADRLDRATTLLDEAYELSTLERAAISEMRLMVRKGLGKRAYDAARDLELQGLKQEAVAAYEAMAVDWPSGLVDEQARTATLKTDIASAEKAYAEGEAAEQKGDVAAALDAFKTARIYYARYKDLAERIARLEAGAKPQGDPAPAPETPAPGAAEPSVPGTGGQGSGSQGSGTQGSGAPTGGS